MRACAARHVLAGKTEAAAAVNFDEGTDRQSRKQAADLCGLPRAPRLLVSPCS